MDAVVCAQTLRWRDSAAFDESLSLSLEPSEVYEFNGRAYTDEAFRNDLTAHLEELGLRTTPTRDIVPLTAEERQAFEDAVKVLEQSGVLGIIATEQALAGDGYGMPAFAAVVVVVAVGLWVYLWNR